MPWPTFCAISWSTVVLNRITLPLAGNVPLSHIAVLTEWPFSPLLVNPVSTLTCDRNRSSGLRIGEYSKPAPSCSGVHSFMIDPCGT